MWPCPRLTTVSFFGLGANIPWRVVGAALVETMAPIVLEFVRKRALAVGVEVLNVESTGQRIPVRVEIIEGLRALIDELRGKVPERLQLYVNA